jgi:nucleotidyltransferase substrate binding protein (TIGR01987 family)
MNIIDGISLDSTIKAFRKFETFRCNTSTEQEKAGAIQAFEYCFELTWKTMRRLLAVRGQTLNSPREVIRAAALESFIDNPELWFDFLKKRNMTVHTYEEDIADDVIAVLESFSNEVQQFLKRIGVATDVYQS